MSTPVIDIRPDHWQIVRHVLRVHVPQYEVWAFGSRAKWTAKPHSDLDLAIITDKPLPLSVSAALADDFSESNLPWKVDVVDWAATSESFRVVIERDKVVVQEVRPGSVGVREWRQLQDVVDEILDRRGVTPLKLGGDFASTGHRVISAKVIKDGRVDLGADEARYVDSDIYRKWMRRPLRTDDVIMTSEAPLGELAYLDRDVDWVLGQRLFAIRPRPHVLSGRFLYYALSAPDVRDSLMARSSGTTVVGIRQAELRKVEIPVPPIEEQHAIAYILGTLDDKIELNRKQNKTLEAMARALFKSWFVDFEPVRAKMDGRWQRGLSLPGLPAHLYDLFPERLVEFELGEIPEGWEHIPFGSLLESTIGGDWGKDAPEDDHNQVVSIIRGTDFPDVSSGGIGKVPTRYTTAKKLASRQLQAGDIVLEISGGSPTQPTGRSIYISESILERFSNAVVCASFCRRFQPKNRDLGALAFMHLQHLYAAGGTWKYQNQSTGIANFQTTRFLESEMVVMPSVALLRVFSAQASTLLQKISNNENLELTKLRDTLLPKLISGEVRVPDAERIF